SGATVVGCGRPEPSTIVAIVHEETAAECSPREIGEIWVAGDGVGTGFWNRPADTAQVFDATLPHRPGVTFLRTGDLGFFDDDALFIVGRTKDVIVVHGENHHAADLEESVARCHPDLSGIAAAFAWQHEGGL